MFFIQSYKDLIVWQKSMDLVVEVYRLLEFLPKEENYALKEQIRRSVISIPSNIAEGQQREYTKEFIHFLSIAKASNAELETQILICLRLKYLEEIQIQTALNLCQEISKMLTKLIKNIKKGNISL